MANSPTAPVPEVLYHYCSTEVFASIVQKQSIWLSSLTLSNDIMEGLMMKQAIMQLAKEERLNDNDCQQLQEYLSLWDLAADGLGFCLSEEGDLLSQWRGYADDGRGVAIGFSRSYLIKLSDELKQNDQPWFFLEKAKYDSDVHRSIIEPDYHKISSSIAAGALKAFRKQKKI